MMDVFPLAAIEKGDQPHIVHAMFSHFLATDAIKIVKSFKFIFLTVFLIQQQFICMVAMVVRSEVHMFQWLWVFSIMNMSKNCFFIVPQSLNINMIMMMFIIINNPSLS